MKRENVSRLDIVNAMANILPDKNSKKIQNDNDAEHNEMELFSEDDDDDTAGMSLEKYAINLNKKAKKGGVDPLIGREKEVERCIQTLCRRRKNNPLLVGEAGVGKTAIAEGLAKLIVEKKVPEELSDWTYTP